MSESDWSTHEGDGSGDRSQGTSYHSFQSGTATARTPATPLCQEYSVSRSPTAPPEGTAASQQPRDTATSQAPASGLNPHAVACTTPSSTTLCVDTSKAVMLQTATADIYNPTCPESLVKVRNILDSGSQRSYITKRTKDALALTPESNQCLSIAAFGSERGSPRRC